MVQRLLENTRRASTDDTFTVEEVSTHDVLVVSYDICSIFTSRHLSETIDITVKLKLQN